MSITHLSRHTKIFHRRRKPLMMINSSCIKISYFLIKISGYIGHVNILEVGHNQRMIIFFRFGALRDNELLYLGK